MTDNNYNKIHSKYYDLRYHNMSHDFFTLSERNQTILYGILEKSNNGIGYYFRNNVETVFSKIDNELLRVIVKNNWLYENDFTQIFVNQEFSSYQFEAYTFLKNEFGFFKQSKLINDLFLSKIKTRKDECYSRFLIWDDKSFEFLFQQGERLDEKDINKKLSPYNATILSLLCKTITPSTLTIFIRYLEDLNIDENLKKILKDKPLHEEVLIPFIEKKQIDSSLIQQQNPNKNKYKL